MFFFLFPPASSFFIPGDLPALYRVFVYLCTMYAQYYNSVEKIALLGWKPGVIHHACAPMFFIVTMLNLFIFFFLEWLPGENSTAVLAEYSTFY